MESTIIDQSRGIIKNYIIWQTEGNTYLTFTFTELISCWKIAKRRFWRCHKNFWDLARDRDILSGKMESN